MPLYSRMIPRQQPAWSSSVTSRTKTLVSTARMFFLQITPHALIELFYLLRSRYRLRKDCPMNVFRRLRAGFAHDDGVALLLPSQRRARADPGFSSHFHRNGNLSLSRNF